MVRMCKYLHHVVLTRLRYTRSGLLKSTSNIGVERSNGSVLDQQVKGCICPDIFIVKWLDRHVR
jgi:hypothetical protein